MALVSVRLQCGEGGKEGKSPCAAVARSAGEKYDRV
jgi:hypothetical protein